MNRRSVFSLENTRRPSASASFRSNAGSPTIDEHATTLGALEDSPDGLAELRAVHRAESASRPARPLSPQGPFVRADASSSRTWTRQTVSIHSRDTALTRELPASTIISPTRGCRERRRTLAGWGGSDVSRHEATRAPR